MKMVSSQLLLIGVLASTALALDVNKASQTIIQTLERNQLAGSTSELFNHSLVELKQSSGKDISIAQLFSKALTRGTDDLTAHYVIVQTINDEKRGDAAVLAVANDPAVASAIATATDDYKKRKSRNRRRPPPNAPIGPQGHRKGGRRVRGEAFSGKAIPIPASPHAHKPTGQSATIAHKPVTGTKPLVMSPSRSEVKIFGKKMQTSTVVSVTIGTAVAIGAGVGAVLYFNGFFS